MIIDFEGPITPADIDGGRYILTYSCLTCNGSMLEVLKSLCHMDVRRAMLACVLSTKTIPCLAGHDGDKALLNLLFEELESLLDIDDFTGHKY